jgi:hypothetical protein
MKEAPLVGWDVAFTNKGIFLLEVMMINPKFIVVLP